MAYPLTILIEACLLTGAINILLESSESAALWCGKHHFPLPCGEVVS